MRTGGRQQILEEKEEYQSRIDLLNQIKSGVRNKRRAASLPKTGRKMSPVPPNSELIEARSASKDTRGANRRAPLPAEKTLTSDSEAVPVFGTLSPISPVGSRDGD